MAVNKHLPHVLVLPEDDANRQMANGFHQQIDQLRQMQVLRPAGGWSKVLDVFKADYTTAMDDNPNCLIVLLIDFDSDDNRFDHAKSTIPNRLADRVFIIGAWSSPEKLKATFGSLEGVGYKLANDCRHGTDVTMQHELLRHNAGEIIRLRERVLPVLFPP